MRFHAFQPHQLYRPSINACGRKLLLMHAALRYYILYEAFLGGSCLSTAGGAQHTTICVRVLLYIFVLVLLYTSGGAQLLSACVLTYYDIS